jgi:hypothetical protein
MKWIIGGILVAVVMGLSGCGEDDLDGDAASGQGGANTTYSVTLEGSGS